MSGTATGITPLKRAGYAAVTSDAVALACGCRLVTREKNGKNVRLAADALGAMKAFPWPGNVRELKNMLERAMTFNDTGVIQLEELEFGGAEPDAEATPPPAASARPLPSGEASLDSMEKEHIIKILKETGGNKKKAAEILGIERRTLYNKAKRLGIDFSSI